MANDAGLIPTNLGPMAPREIVDWLTYSNYVHNRRRSPEVTPEQWATIYPNAAAMERTYQAELATTEAINKAGRRHYHGLMERQIERRRERDEEGGGVMIKNVRRKVVRFETRPNTHPESSKLWPLSSSAILECGHVKNLGVGTDYRPKRMACVECGPAKVPA